MCRKSAAILLGGTILLGLTTFWSARTTVSAQQPAAADAAPAALAVLTGTVGSSQERRMEGVLVSARRQGSTKTITVVSNADGVYSFPRGRLEPGKYDVTIRAAGYVIPSPTASMPVDIAAAPATLDLNLRQANILERALQMTDPEWLVSYPLDDKTKFDLLRDCNRCHTLRRPSMSTYTKEQLPWVLKRMSYSSGSSPMTFQLSADQTEHFGRAEWGEPTPLNKRQADAVAVDQPAQRQLELRTEDVAASEGQRDAGDLHDVGSAGDEPAARHA